MGRQAPPPPASWVEIRKQHRAQLNNVVSPDRPKREEAVITSRRYKAVSHKAVHGIEPGNTGELELTDSQELSLVQAGLLERVKSDEPPAVETKKEDPVLSDEDETESEEG